MSDVAYPSCDAVQQAHSDWLVFHNSATGLWSAYRRLLPGRPDPGGVLLVRAGSAEELDRKLTAQEPLVIPPSIRAVAAARALQARTTQIARTVQCSTGLRRLLRS
ncbi:hypothetical protein ACFQ08_02585 [Streptosporangium algeriense]|uniref:Uncharacterized protein n=1 Tax=Streptosporangium algeriense TaxID=1682748 RepID=A0ABW3DI92_9ACTN